MSSPLETCPECSSALTEDDDGLFCRNCGWDEELDSPGAIEPNDFDDHYYRDEADFWGDDWYEDDYGYDEDGDY